MMALQKYKKRFSNFMDLSFNCITEDRYIYVKNKNDECFKTETPFLKVLKPYHINKNKSYIILSINDDFDFNDEINDFVYLINKIHEFSQENIKLESKKWFGKDFDIFDLDNIVKRPIEEHKSNNYIKLVIPNNELLEQKILNLSKDTYVKCNIEFQGLKISKETLMEEWFITDFITQEEIDEKSKLQYVSDLKIQQDTFEYNEEKLNNDKQDVESYTQENQLNNETQNEELNNNETQNEELNNNETQNEELNNNETQNEELNNNETQNVESNNNETQKDESNNNETQKDETQNLESNNNDTQNEETIDINNLHEEIEVISVVDDKKKKSKSKKNDKSLNDKKKKTNLIGRKKVYTL
jgi:hypothetical protein